MCFKKQVKLILIQLGMLQKTCYYYRSPEQITMEVINNRRGGTKVQ